MTALTRNFSQELSISEQQLAIRLYTRTSLQRPPWGQQSGRCKEVLNKSQCMDFLSAGTKNKWL